MNDPIESVRAAFDRIAALDDLAVIISVVERGAALDRAAALAQSDARGACFGTPVLVKDNIAVAGIPTGAACPAFADGPAPASAAVVERLEAEGAIVIGTTNMDQFATGLVGTRSPYGAPRNPCAPAYIPGGSSSGSAVAVARGVVPLAIGTDTAGSGRVPAACTNTVGFKPTRNLIGTGGIVPAIPGLDCVSIHTRTVVEAWAALEAIAGPVPHRGRGGDPARIGRVPASVVAAECEPAVRDAYARTCAKVGAHVEIDMEPFFAAGALLYGAFVAARTAAFGAFLAEHPDAVDPVVAAVVARGDDVTGADVFRARDELDRRREQVRACFDAIDVLLVPTIPMLPTLAEVAREPFGVNARLGRFTDFVNLLGCCAVAVPGEPRTDGLPFGVSAIAAGGGDAVAAAVAARVHDEPWALPARGGPARVAVVGAHLAGLPLHHQLVDLDARLVETTCTAPHYRLYALAGTTPPKPGLVRDPTGAAVECEVYALGEAELGRFVAGVAAPLAIGPVTLADGSVVPGFVAAAGALDGATDITAYGGWRAYVADRSAVRSQS